MKIGTKILSSPWKRYSKKLQACIDHPKNAGFFSEQDAGRHNMRLVVGKEKDEKEENIAYLYWLVNISDGVIADAKFQVFGNTALIGALEVVCELIVHKNYDQAHRLTTDLIDKHVRDKKEVSAFPSESLFCVQLVLEAVDRAAIQCRDIPFAENYVAPPMPIEQEGEEQAYPGWKELSVEQKIVVLEEVIAKEIRPYVALDAGNIKVLNFLLDNEVIIGYEGSCTSCHSATGATLDAVQRILRSRIYPDLVVIPNISFLTPEEGR